MEIGHEVTHEPCHISHRRNRAIVGHPRGTDDTQHAYHFPVDAVRRNDNSQPAKFIGRILLPDEYLNPWPTFQARQDRAQEQTSSQDREKFLRLRGGTELRLIERMLETRMPQRGVA